MGGRGPGARDVFADVTDFALRVAVGFFFGVSQSGSTAPVRRAIEVALRFVNRRTESLVNLPLWLPTRANRRFEEAIGALDAFVYALLSRPRAPGGTDLVSTLLAVRAQAPGGLSERQLRDELVTFLLAGHETTANALAWTFDLLARHPEVQQRVRAEADALTGGAAVGPQHMTHLPYTTCVAREAMRLRPPAWVIERVAKADDDLAVPGGRAAVRIPAGATVWISPYVVHRRPDLWPDPDAFDPTRFATPPAHAGGFAGYLPFGDGPRGCVGEALAMAELRVVVAEAVRRFDLRPAREEPPRRRRHAQTARGPAPDRHTPLTSPVAHSRCQSCNSTLPNRSAESRSPAGLARAASVSGPSHRRWLVARVVVGWGGRNSRRAAAVRFAIGGRAHDQRRVKRGKLGRNRAAP